MTDRRPQPRSGGPRRAYNIAALLFLLLLFAYAYYINWPF